MVEGRHHGHEAMDTSVAGIAQARWGVRPVPASERFEVPGWWYEEPSPLPCPKCAGQLHALRKLYDGPNRKPDDKPSFLVAVVCPALRGAGKAAPNWEGPARSDRASLSV